MAKNLRIGDLVAPRTSWEGAAQEQNLAVAIVIEVRRNDCRVYNPSTRKGSWIDNRDIILLRVVSGERTVLAKISRLLFSLEAIECEVHALPDGAVRLHVSHEALDVSLLDELREFLNDDLLHLRIEPQGMALIKTVIEFR